MMWTSGKIIEKIRRDFPEGGAPSGVSVSKHEDAKFFFSGKKWTDLSGDVYIRDGAVYGDWDSYLPYLSNEAFAYFLPGHMIMCLQEKDPDRLRFIPQSLVMSLELLKDKTNANRYFDRAIYLCDHLTLPQKQDVALYLQHQLHHYGSQFTTMDAEEALARKSLDSYWHQFLPEEKPGPPSPAPK